MGEHRVATGLSVIKRGAGSQNLRAKVGASSTDDFVATTRNRGAARRAAGLDQLRAMGEHRVATGLSVIKRGAGSQNLRAKVGASSTDDFVATTRNRGAARRAAGLDQLRAMGEHRVATGIAVIKLRAGSQNLRAKVGAPSADDFAATTRNRDALRRAGRVDQRRAAAEHYPAACIAVIELRAGRQNLRAKVGAPSADDFAATARNRDAPPRAARQYLQSDTAADRSAAQRIAGANLLGAASTDCRGAADLRATQKFQDTPALHGDTADRPARRHLQRDAAADRGAAQRIAGANLLGAANTDGRGAADLRTTQKFQDTPALHGDTGNRAARRHLQRDAAADRRAKRITGANFLSATRIDRGVTCNGVTKQLQRAATQNCGVARRPTAADDLQTTTRNRGAARRGAW